MLDLLTKKLKNRGENTPTWINVMCVSFETVALKKRQVSDYFNHLFTASRGGSSEVRDKYLRNMFYQALLTSGLFLVWYIGSSWFFKEFDITYWVVTGDFFKNFWYVACPAMILAFLYGQLDWFGSSDPYEDGTIIAENLPFKWLVSAGAGVFEEITHRGVYIFWGLIAVFATNFFFEWVLFLIGIGFMIWICAILEFKLIVTVPILGLAGYVLYKINTALMDDAFIRLNGWVFNFYKDLSLNVIATGVSIGVLMALFLFISVTNTQVKQPNYHMSIPEFVSRVVIFAVWSAYCLPLAMKAIDNNPITPNGANEVTSLLYLSAILWSNTKFRRGHKYQGLSGMLNSYVFGFYMFHIAFNYGLVYAMMTHFLFDAVLFTSEHLCQAWKNRRMVA